MGKLASMSPQAIADRQVNAAQAATSAYTAGVNAVSVAPGQAAAAQSAKWLQNVTASQALWARRVAAVSLQSWQQITSTKGAQRLGQGVAAAKPKIVAYWTAAVPKMQSLQAQIRSMPSTALADRIQRAVAWMQGMSQLRGTFS